MHTSSPRSAELQDALARLRAGQLSARDQLLQYGWDEIGCLARRSFRRFPRLHPLLEVDDVRQRASLRLWQALGKICPDSMEAFFGLVRTQIRRVLLDLVREHTTRAAHEDNSGWLAAEFIDRADAPDELERWSSLHALIEALPASEHEVVGLLLYQGLSQCQAAAVLRVTVRTVHRLWRNARRTLRQGL